MRRFSLVLAALLVLPPAEARAIDSKTPGPGRGDGSPQLDGQLLARGGGGGRGVVVVPGAPAAVAGPSGPTPASTAPPAVSTAATGPPAAAGVAM